MINRLSSLEIDSWDFIEIWCLEFEISEILNTRVGGVLCVVVFKQVGTSNEKSIFSLN
jgi:hypothetical protein